MKTKAQISFEFIMIFTLVFTAIIIFIALINTRLSEINEQQELQLMKNLASNIKSEIILASSVSNNYMRKFNLPEKISGKSYKLDLNKEELTIRLVEGNTTTREYFTIFPIQVKGNFYTNITYNKTEHCITKNDYDGIRIARSQASLDANQTTAKKGERFDVIFSLNCVENIKSTRFTVKYDSTKLEIQDSETVPITLLNKKYVNPLFRDYEMEFKYLGKDLGEQYGHLPFTEPGRYTYAFLGKDCADGSGNVAKLTFKVLDDAALGNTEITFDDNFQNQELLILDCSTNRYTTQGIPTTKQGTAIEIQE